jgi:hypothetical protein
MSYKEDAWTPKVKTADYDYLVEPVDGKYRAVAKDGEVLKESVDAATVLQEALNALTPNRAWYEKVVLKGELNLQREITVPAYTRIRGGRITGKGDFLIYDGYAAIEDVEFNVDNSYNACIFIYASNKTLENVKVRNCRAVDCGRMLLIISGTGTPKTVKNVTVKDCEAYNCGRYSRFNDWVTGYDCENADLENVRFINCYAYRSWESGFHFGTAPTKKNVKLIGCISEYNGIDKASPTYAAGFLASAGIHLLGCISRGNAKCGYRIRPDKNDVVVLEDCKDYNSKDGLDIASYDAGKTILNNVTVFENTRYGIVALQTGNIFAKGLKIINPTGDGSICTLLGSSTYPIHDCEFELYAWGGGSPNVIYTNGSSNLLFKGYINTTQTYPFKNVGGTNVKALFLHGSYVTKRMFTATIPANQTSVTVAHGLSATPTKVIVTPRGNIGSVWVSARDATNITINCSTAPTTDTVVDVEAEV